MYLVSCGAWSINWWIALILKPSFNEFIFREYVSYSEKPVCFNKDKVFLRKTQGFIRSWGKIQLAYLGEKIPQGVHEIHKKVTKHKTNTTLLGLSQILR